MQTTTEQLVLEKQLLDSSNQTNISIQNTNQPTTFEKEKTYEQNNSAPKGERCRSIGRWVIGTGGLGGFQL